MNLRSLLLTALALTLPQAGARVSAAPFEGHITAVTTRGGEQQSLSYTVATNALRVEVAGSSRPNPVDILDRATGELTLLYPHNRSFVRLKDQTGAGPGQPGRPAAGSAGNLPVMPSLPPPPAGVGPQPPPGLPPGVSIPEGAANLPGMPALPPPGMKPAGGMPPLPLMPMPEEAVEWKATGDQTNLLGYACAKFELQQGGEIMEIWATDELLPFQPYVRHQPLRFGPRMVEEQWGELLRARKLFPLAAVLKFKNGPERFRYTVTRVAAEKIADQDGALFQPPADYQQLEPLPF